MYNKLSADPTSLVLGIISLVVIFVGCCCGFVVPVALALAIIGLVQANKSLREYHLAPENYNVQSRGNVNAGKIICIIGIVLSGLYMLVLGIYFAFVGTVMSDEIFRKLREGRFEQRYDETEDDANAIEDDSTYVLQPSAETDTIAADSSAIEIKTIH